MSYGPFMIAYQRMGRSDKLDVSPEERFMIGSGTMESA